MQDIRAFIAHSFEEDDEQVLNQFIKCFTKLRETVLPGFTWKSAEPAEARDLAQKVLAAMKDRNLFIAICTRREYVALPADFSTRWYARHTLTIPRQKVQWKTADWIIQEIGLAVGRDLPLILLLESGVRPPGGLQGNVEYIPFERASIEQSYLKILEMISSLAPRISGVSSQTGGAPVTADDPKEPAADDSDNWFDPKPEWSLTQFRDAFTHMVILKDRDGGRNITDTYLRSQDAGLGHNRDRWEAFCEYIQVLFSNAEISSLRRLADTYPDDVELRTFLAEAYECRGAHEVAARAFEIASQRASDEKELARLRGRAAVAFARAQMPATASKIIDELRAQPAQDNDAEYGLLQVLLDLSNVFKTDTSTLAITERMLELRPTDSDARFRLAYKHSQSENNDVALLHYRKIHPDSRSGIAWNNLGVAYREFAMPAKAVVAYRAAEAMQETLAMSNLADLLTTAGFSREAEDLCKKAMAISDYHRNVPGTLARLKALPEQEDETLTTILEKAERKSKFYRDFGKALSQARPIAVKPHWIGPNCTLKVDWLTDSFSAVGTFERDMGLGLAAYMFATTERKTTRFNVEYRGAPQGRAIEATLTTLKEGSSISASGLLSEDTVKKVLMFISDRGDEIHAMELVRGTPTFYSIKQEDE